MATAGGQHWVVTLPSGFRLFRIIPVWSRDSGPSQSRPRRQRPTVLDSQMFPSFMPASFSCTHPARACPLPPLRPRPTMPPAGCTRPPSLPHPIHPCLSSVNTALSAARDASTDRAVFCLSPRQSCQRHRPAENLLRWTALKHPSKWLTWTPVNTEIYLAQPI